MPAPLPLTVAHMQLLANRAAQKFGGRFPPGITHQDAVQDALVVILRVKDDWNARIHLCERDAFLVMRAWGDLKDQYGRGWREEYVRRDSAPTPIPSSAESAESADIQMDVRAALAVLTDREREVMEMHLDEKSQDEIGKALRITQSAVSQIMTRARSKMQEFLGAYG